MPIKRLFSLLMTLVMLLFAVPALANGTVWRFGDETVPKIAITVDDCYKKENVKAVLDLCEKYGVVVTFFPVGSTIKPEDGEMWQRALDLGNEIGNHTYTHKSLAKEGMTYQAIRSQFIRLEKALDTALGYHYQVRCYRPPYGKDGGAAHWRIYEKCGYPDIIKWSISQTDPDKCIKLVQNGSILLFHANAKDVKCLDQLIPAVLSAGYTPVTVTELLGLEPVEREREPDEMIFPEEQAAEPKSTPAAE